MKESKPYPIFEEEDGSCLTAAEPVEAVAYSEPYTRVEPHHIPGLPETWDELLECLKEGEEEIERGGGTPWEEVVNEVRMHRNNHVA